MADRKALCLVSGGLAEIAPEDRLILPGDPDFDLHAASKQYVDRRFSHGLDTGEAIYPRPDLASNAVTCVSQTMRLVFFTATKSLNTTQVRVIGGATAAAATPTLIENGLFTIGTSGDGTRVTVTGNDTSLYSVANSTYTRSWLAAYNMVIGLRYALSWLVVSSFAVPTYTGMNIISTATTESSFPPRITGTIPGQTATPTAFTAASVVAVTSRPYGVILP